MMLLTVLIQGRGSSHPEYIRAAAAAAELCGQRASDAWSVTLLLMPAALQALQPYKRCVLICYDVMFILAVYCDSHRSRIRILRIFFILKI